MNAGGKIGSRLQIALFLFILSKFPSPHPPPFISTPAYLILPISPPHYKDLPVYSGTKNITIMQWNMYKNHGDFFLKLFFNANFYLAKHRSSFRPFFFCLFFLIFSGGHRKEYWSELC